MTVRCPRCGTAYRHRGRSRPSADTTFRCARCRHVFEVTRDEPTLGGAEEDDAFVDEAPDRPRDEPAFTLGDDENTEDADDMDDRSTPAARRASPPEPAFDGAPPARFALRALLGITLGYAVLSIYLYTHPESVRHAVGGVPFLGPGLADTRVSPGNVQLTDVHGAYRRVKGDRLVFTIAATAINNARMPVRGIQVAGRIVGTKDDRQVVFCGAANRDVQDLSLREIALLQTIEPPREWTLGPGEQVSCLIVFTEPAPDLREFAVEVVAVQAPPRRRAQEG